MIYIGIDTGKNTGFAVWDDKRAMLIAVETYVIHKAMEEVLRYYANGSIFVRFEDARKRNWFGKAGREQLQGAGSIKRDCTIWEDFLTDKNISYEAVAPSRNITKLSAKQFKKITGWQNKTNEHSRDAAMLVFGYKQIIPNKALNK
ncbi:MAG: hypothetical protein LBE11_00720 [Prevotellaceae bacterium]|jgi:hypothetical protein|nr:hypothetical protein [Prevotellaceae bacterium]